MNLRANPRQKSKVYTAASTRLHLEPSEPRRWRHKSATLRQARGPSNLRSVLRDASGAEHAADVTAGSLYAEQALKSDLRGLLNAEIDEKSEHRRSASPPGPVVRISHLA